MRPRQPKPQPEINIPLPTPIEEQTIEEKLRQPLKVEETQGYSHESAPTSSQHSPDNHSTLSSCCDHERKATLSAASIDSGIRDSESSSPDHHEDDSKRIVDI
jgi:hypothetical protein